MRSSLFRRLIALAFVALLPLAILPSAARAQVSVGVSINIAPPALPVYVQPAIPAPGYIWTPGYWAWGAFGYYWVPGTWVAPPAAGLLWTPGYWGWSGGIYVWHAGYWGPHIGFYGGVNYGFGYPGHGYSRAMINARGPSRVSFNGGPGGIVARPTPGEIAAAHEHHVAFTPAQRRHIAMAAGNPALRASANGGRPAIAATSRPGAFSGHGVVAAHAAGGSAHFTPVRANEAHAANGAQHRPAPEHHAAPRDAHPANAHGGGHEPSRPEGDRKQDR